MKTTTEYGGQVKMNKNKTPWYDRGKSPAEIQAELDIIARVFKSLSAKEQDIVKKSLKKFGKLKEPNTCEKEQARYIVYRNYRGIGEENLEENWQYSEWYFKTKKAALAIIPKPEEMKVFSRSEDTPLHWEVWRLFTSDNGHYADELINEEPPNSVFTEEQKKQLDEDLAKDEAEEAKAREGK